jgi:MscS family membrane protein
LAAWRGWCPAYFVRWCASHGVELLKRVGLEVDEMLLVFETIANVMIGFMAVLIFAQSQQFNLVGPVR